LLAMAVAAAQGLGATRAILWQPVIDGARYLAQLLRLRLAASLGAGSKETASGLRDRLLGGEALEIGGYRIASALAQELDQEKLEPLVMNFRGPLTWLEVVADSGDALTPASTQVIDRAKLQGIKVLPVAIGGEPYWASAELVRNPELVRQTVAALALPS
ncbi:MAG: hypothetical protein ACRET4_14730, partial [Steroidobacteraceae bacterium]